MMKKIMIMKKKSKMKQMKNKLKFGLRTTRLEVLGFN
jgi:hypothetical protein